MAFLAIEHLRKSFGTLNVVEDFDLAVRQGEFISFLGPSGCGKTTALRCLAGLESAGAGRITFGDTVVFDAAGNAEGYDDVFTRLDTYLAHCRSVGLGEDWVRSLIR